MHLRNKMRENKMTKWNSGIVLENKRIRSTDIYIMKVRLKGDVDPSYPGQFVNIRCSKGTDPLLRRPISILRFDPAENIFEIVYEVRGKGTQYLSLLKQGEDLDVLGPLGNRFCLKEEYERVYGYVLIDPNYVQDIEGEAKKYHLDYKIPGLKMFYARTRVRYNDPVYDPWWKIANENSLFALTDNGSYPSFLNDVEELAIRYPNVTFFLDHAGQSFDVAINYAQYAKKYPNVYLQITYTSVTQGVIEYFVQEGLAGKVLYGTDSPMRDPRPQLGWVAYANISYEDKKKILGENMEGILKRCFKKN
jgi:hypothetical protein